MTQDCIWPRAILCIVPAQETEVLAGFPRFNLYKTKIAPGITQSIASNKNQSYLDVTHAQIGAGSPEMIARLLQRKLGASTRIGLSINIPLSQYAVSRSATGIPCVIAPWKIDIELGDAYLSKLPFIQKIFLQRLNLHGINKVRQFTKLSRPEISRRFSLQGLLLLDILHGQDRYPDTYADNQTSRQIIQYLVLPPNTRGRQLILRYLKQISFRLANMAQMQKKSGKNIQLNIFYKKHMKTGISIEAGNMMNGKMIFGKLVSQFPEKFFTKVILAMELSLLDIENISGQDELLLECLS